MEERVEGLRELLSGGDVSKAVSRAPQLLLNDVKLSLRPRMTRLVVALSVYSLEGVLDADKVLRVSTLPNRGEFQVSRTGPSVVRSPLVERLRGRGQWTRATVQATL